MNWIGIFWVYILSTIKFMVSPITGLLFDLTFLETYLAAVAGGITGAAIFYFPADYLMIRNQKKRQEELEKAIKEGRPIKQKKVFTRMNRLLIWIKLKMGQVGISFWAPLLLSIPIGSIVVAKFYGKSKKTFPLIVLGMFINGLITTSLTYLFYTK